MPSKKTLYPTPTSLSAPSFFKKVSDKAPKVYSWDDVFAKITQDPDITRNTKTARALLAQGNKVGYGRQKSNRKRFAKRYASHTPPAYLRDTSQSTPTPRPATHAEDDEHPTQRNDNDLQD